MLHIYLVKISSFHDGMAIEEDLTRTERFLAAESFVS